MEVKTTVVHCQKQKYDIYIGRHSNPAIGKWGNPFSHREGTKAEFVVKNRTEAIAKYKEWILQRPKMMEDLIELKGKRLGCWCTYSEEYRVGDPLVCHGQILQILIDYPHRLTEDTNLPQDPLF